MKTFSDMVSNTVNKIVEKLKEETCEECDNPIEDCTCVSPCCGATIIHHDLCSNCYEHI